MTTPEPARAEPVGEPLFCVHILGPDDVYPAPDRLTAFRWAATMNSAMLHLNQDADDYGYVICHANVEEYDGTPEQHAAGLAHAIAQMTVPRGLTPPAQAVEIDYTNHEGKRAVRKIKPTGRMLVGFDKWHPDAPWLIEARDVDRNFMRTFDPAKIHRWGAPAPASDAGLAEVERLLDGVCLANQNVGAEETAGTIKDLCRAKDQAREARADIATAFAAQAATIAALRAERDRLLADAAGRGEGVSEDLRALSERATPGPYCVIAGDDYIVFSDAVPTEFPHHFKGDDAGRHVAWMGNRAKDFGRADADLFVAAVNDLRARIAAAPAPATDGTGGGK